MINFGLYASDADDLFEEVGKEVPQKDLHIVVLGKSDSDGTFADILKDVCKKKNIKYTLININDAWISAEDVEKGYVTVRNYDDEKTSIVLNRNNTILFTRAAAIDSLTSQSIVVALQNFGFFLVNDLKSSLLCDNKMSTALAFEYNNIPSPKTSILINENSIENAHKKIGGKFPIILKTLRGTQGIGVSIIDSMASLNSVAQSLWKYNADILIQEFLDIDYDIRTIVVDNKIIASTKRTRAKDSSDFRNNIHRGATTKPYQLSKDEIRIVKAAARTSGTLYCGVDHCIYNGKAYVLEVNSSPGIGSIFNEYDLETGKPLGKTTAENIVERVVDYFSFESHRHSNMIQEAGYLEQINIIGYGPIRAKLDTGNGTKASMFVVDKIEHDNKTVKWEKDGKKFVSKLQGMSYPQHVGKIDERPIVLIDIRFNNKLYKDVPIGLATKDSKSTFLVNRDLITRFNVSVNPHRKFVLSDWIERSDHTDL